MWYFSYLLIHSENMFMSFVSQTTHLSRDSVGMIEKESERLTQLASPPDSCSADVTKFNLLDHTHGQL